MDIHKYYSKNRIQGVDTMKKRIIAVLGILAVLSSILLAGCSESGSESKTKKETIGIIVNSSVKSRQ